MGALRLIHFSFLLLLVASAGASCGSSQSPPSGTAPEPKPAPPSPTSQVNAATPETSPADTSPPEVVAAQPEPAAPPAVAEPADAGKSKSPQYPAVFVPDEWRTCKKAADCVKVPKYCSDCCQYEAVNRAHEADYKSKQAELCEGYDGPQCDCTERKGAKARCEKKACVYR